MQAWRVAHPPRRGHWWLASLPLVHSGFYYSWTANGLNRRALFHASSLCLVLAAIIQQQPDTDCREQSATMEAAIHIMSCPLHGLWYFFLCTQQR